VPVAEAIVTHRAAYLAAMSSGRSAPEIDRSGATGKEISALWAEVKAALEPMRAVKERARHG
jgi:hypothetical protein